MISQQKQNIQFADYAPLLDAEQVLRTAQVKQNLADENIATIKSTVDAYSRLRSYMINDASKNYFDQELKKLTSAIRDSAGLDFSNKGNLANVLAIGRPFENDKYIINGLKAGKEKEKRVTELSSMDPSLRNEDNDLVYMQDIYDYMQNGGLDSTVQHNKAYTPYVDVTEELLKMEKDIQGFRSQVIDEQLGKTGYIDFAIVEEKTKEEVLKRFGSLSPEYNRQIQIHAQAQMYRMGKENTYNDVKDYWTKQKEQESRTVQMATQAYNESKVLFNRTGKQEHKNDMLIAQEILKESERKIRTLDENIYAPPENFNPDEYIGLFKTRFLNDIAERAAYKKTKHEIKSDELGKMRVQHNYTMAQISQQNRNAMNLATMKDIQQNFTQGPSLTWRSGEGPGTIVSALKALGKKNNKDYLRTKASELGEVIADLETEANNATGTEKRLLDQYVKLLQKIQETKSSTANLTVGKIGEASLNLPTILQLGTNFHMNYSGNLADAYENLNNFDNIGLGALLIGGEFTVMQPTLADESFQKAMQLVIQNKRAEKPNFFDQMAAYNQSQQSGNTPTRTQPNLNAQPPN